MVRNGLSRAMVRRLIVILATGAMLLPISASAATAGPWSATGSMATARSSHTATALADGKVLVVGGQNGNTRLASAELYDPATASWSSAGSTAEARIQHTATLLANGKVLVTGGISQTNYLASAELYDPATNSWSSAGSMSTIRQGGHQATLLSNGKVLVTGGYDTGPSFIRGIRGSLRPCNEQLVAGQPDDDGADLSHVPRPSPMGRSW